MTIDVLSLAQEAAATAVDQTQATKGGEGYTPPAAGLCPARLVGYIETGVHERSVGAGKPKVQKPQVKLIFELLGPKHPAKEQDGVAVPVRITEDFNASSGYGPLNEKAGLYKVFKRMNYAGKARHLSQLLGQPFLVTVVHSKSADGKKTFAGLRDESGYQISPPQQTDALTGDVKIIDVPQARSPLRLFLWNAAPEVIGKMWETLFIDGEYPQRTDDTGNVTSEARSKNVLQQAIKDAINFKDSPIFQYLQTGGQQLNLGAAVAKPQATQPAVSDDPLAGVA